jgi:hypothetical protein
MIDARGLQLKDVSFTISQHSFAVLAADFNHDKNIDLAVVDGVGGGIVVFNGNGDGTFAAATQVDRVPASPRGLGAGDFNRDGALDLVVGITKKDQVRVYDGVGNGQFRPGEIIGSYPFLLTVADLNRDDSDRRHR